MSILNKCNYDLFLSCSIKDGLCKSLVHTLESKFYVTLTSLGKKSKQEAESWKRENQHYRDYCTDWKEQYGR